MKCNICGQKEANVKIVKVINGEQTVTHLCEDCARAKGDLNFSQSGFNLSNLLTDFFNLDITKSQFTPVNKSQVKCSKCGLTWHDFQSHSRLGCNECYETFKTQLLPLIRRVHGNVAHQGQVPKTKEPHLAKEKMLKQLKINLQEAIVEERFEDAAEYRDNIKKIEKEIEGSNNE
jgi:protein arginine kinase activator